MGAMGEEVIPVLRVKDAAVAVAWYERLGFVKQWEHRSEPQCPAFVELARGPMRLSLSEHEADACPGMLLYLRLDNVDTVVAEFGADSQDWFYGCEIELTDPDGNRLRVGPRKV
jgi:hypothetical protein